MLTTVITCRSTTAEPQEIDQLLNLFGGARCHAPSLPSWLRFNFPWEGVRTSGVKDGSGQQAEKKKTWRTNRVMFC